ncbi:MAG: hypothetical protein WCW78_00740 [Candidatus Paceibacterota bacterium]|jgi:enolase
MYINDIRIRQIFDSRGEPTIEIELHDKVGFSHRAAVPSGKSRGTREASVFTFEEATKAVNHIKESITAHDFKSVGEVDAFLLLQDSTPTKEKLGGNVLLGISIAAARGFAHTAKKELWEIIREEYFAEIKDTKPPLIFSNFINGGAHANNNLDIQEFLVIARTNGSITVTTEKLIELYRVTGNFLKKKYNVKNLPIGDEGGYSLDFLNNSEPLAMLEASINENDLGQECMLGLDVAASHFGDKGAYVFEKKEYTRATLVELYESYFKKIKLLYSIEDPFGENDSEGFIALRKAVPNKIIIGDDLTTTNQAEIEAHTAEGAVNGVIIKPNQIGTVSETCAAIKAARMHHAQIIVSHRSGETEDTFIIHLAKAANADGVKIGAPVKERMLKFNELIRLYS